MDRKNRAIVVMDENRALDPIKQQNECLRVAIAHDLRVCSIATTPQEAATLIRAGEASTAIAAIGHPHDRLTRIVEAAGGVVLYARQSRQSRQPTITTLAQRLAATGLDPAQIAGVLDTSTGEIQGILGGRHRRAD